MLLEAVFFPQQGFPKGKSCVILWLVYLIFAFGKLVCTLIFLWVMWEMIYDSGFECTTCQQLVSELSWLKNFLL